MGGMHGRRDEREVADLALGVIKAEARSASEGPCYRLIR